MLEDPRTSLLRTHLAERAKLDPPGTGILAAVSSGAFALVPPSLRWSESHEVAHLINGYELAKAAGLGDLAHHCNERKAEAKRAGWVGDLLELWLCLYGEHRRARHGGGYPPEGEELVLLNHLCSAFASACAATAADGTTPRHREWTDECANLLEHFVWEPQHLGQRKDLPPELRRSPAEVVRRVMAQEVPLNHQLNLFFRIAPPRLAERWFGSLLSKTSTAAPVLVYSRDYDTPVCQPDMYFRAGGARLFVELKVNAVTGPDQLYRYAALAAWLDQREGAQPWAIVFMGPRTRRFESIRRFVEDPASHALSHKALARCADMNLPLPEIDAALARMEFATTSFAAFDHHLAAEDESLGASDTTLREGDLALRNLIGGIRIFLRPLLR